LDSGKPREEVEDEALAERFRLCMDKPPSEMEDGVGERIGYIV